MSKYSFDFQSLKNKISFFVTVLIFISTAFATTSIFFLKFETNPVAVNCPFSGHSMSICKMNPMEHVQEWQNMFTSLPVKLSFSILFILFLFIAIKGAVPWYRFSFLNIKYQYTKYLFKTNFYIPNPIKEAYSGGILNPKLF